MKIESYFDMPKEAVHTSGLACDKNKIWAVDYKSDKVYQINLNKSFRRKKAVIENEFETKLKGTSACCIIIWKKKKCLVISDFMNSKKTIFVDVTKLIKNKNIQNAIVFSYQNQGFSQGLEYINGFLYESENKLFNNVINKLDISLLEKTKKSSDSTIMRLSAPKNKSMILGVEDICWDGKNLWTTDEHSFRFYSTKTI